MQYLGNITSGTTIRGSFNTRTLAGVPITLAGSPVVSVYKDASTTETVTGVTLTVDFDSRTGHHVFEVVTSDAFYATGSDYRVVITTGTVSGTSVVGTEVGSFSIENRALGSGGLDAAGVRSAIGLASANLDTQLSGIPAAVWASGTRTLSSFGTLVSDIWSAGTRTLTAISDSSGITTLLSRIVGTLSAGTHNPQSGDSFTRIGTPVGASISDDIATRLPTSTYEAPPSSSTIASDVWSAVTRTITGGTIATVSDKTGYSLTQTFPANFASLGINASGHIVRVVLVDTTTSGGLDAAGIRAAIGLASADLDTQLSNIPTTSEFNARSIPSDEYFVVSDYTAPDAAKLIDVWKRLGLDPSNPLVNSATLISSGSGLQIGVATDSTQTVLTRQ
jgi:hypothetical protein